MRIDLNPRSNLYKMLDRFVTAHENIAEALQQMAVLEKAGCDPYQEEGKEPWERENTQEESET